MLGKWFRGAGESIKKSFKGQDCSYENPKAYTASELADLGIGRTQQVTGTCTTAGQSERRWCPNNGEFVSSKSSACAFNSTNRDGRQFHCGPKNTTWAGCGGPGTNWVGQCEIVGSSTKCERRSFSADPAACCKADGTKIIGGKTCDPQYRTANSSSCRGVIREHCNGITTNPDSDPACKTFMAISDINDTEIRNAYCSRGDNLFKSRMCSSWVTDPKSNNTTVIDTLMRNKCKGDALSKDPCKSYVINRSTNDASYDYVMTKYCVQNPDSLLCRCIMSKHNENTIGSLKGRPECIDPACAGLKGAESPFKTFDMNQNSDNCSYINCQQWVEFGPTIGVENQNIADMEMNCGNTEYVKGNDAPDVPIADGKDNQTKGIIALLLFVAVLFFLFIGLPLIQEPSHESSELYYDDYDQYGDYAQQGTE
jgi:hypothetical protein